MLKKFKLAIYLFLSGLALFFLSAIFKIATGWLIVSTIFSAIAFIPIFISIVLAIVIIIITNKFT